MLDKADVGSRKAIIRLFSRCEHSGGLVRVREKLEEVFY